MSDVDDSLLHQTIENSIVFTLKQLGSQEFATVLSTVTKIRNLIIGNNKYKAFFMNDELIKRLIQLITLHMENKSDPTSGDDLTSQIVIIFASFSLGNLENTIQLVSVHKVHLLLFDQIKRCVNEQSIQNRVHVKLIESSMRCISNLYTTCQLIPSLIYLLDKSLYACVDVEGEVTCLNLLLKAYPISNLTKRTVIQIVSISSTFLTSLLSSSNRYVTDSVNTRKHTRMVKLNQQIKHRRHLLIKSDCISKFAHLLTSLLEPVQLNVLKFYSSICFENIDALNLILTSSYYECGLLDLINGYLSRENSAELQLYASICLTNLCRTLQILNNSRNQTNLTKNSAAKMTRSSYQFKKLVKQKIDDCTSGKFDEPDFDNEADYEEDDDNDIGDDLHEDSESAKASEEEFESKTPPTDAEDGLANEECNKCDVEAVTITKLESLYKHVDASSQLIKKRTLPTLIRLCCTYSGYYRSINMKSSNFVDLVHSQQGESNQRANNQQNPLDRIAQSKETNSPQYYLNLALLIQSINTLSYLIELNADLQTTASFLEQIIPTLAINILDAYSMQSINKIRLNIKPANKLYSRTKDQEPMREGFHENFNLEKNLKKDIAQVECDVNSSSLPFTDETEVKSMQSEGKVSDKELSSLYSMFYLNYSQYTLKVIQFKRNEHQYHQLASLYPVQSVKCNEMLVRVQRFLSMLDKTVHKRLASACFHALAALAANNEENRRQITENSSLVCRLVDSIQLNKRRKKVESDSEDDEDNDGDQNYASDCEESSKYAEREEAFRLAEAEATSQKIEVLLCNIKSEILTENNYYSDANDTEDDFINTLDEEFDDYNQTDSDLLRLSGLCLLHSLSRSVHQLRTKFLDKKIWMPIIDLIKRSRKRRLEKKLLVLKFRRLRIIQLEQDKKEKLARNREIIANTAMATRLDDVMVKTSEDDMEEMDFKEDLEAELGCEVYSLNEQNLLSVTTAILANLLLEFSPSKEIMEENGIIKILVELVDHKNHSIRVNSMWALMNTAFQADQVVKQQIISTMTMEKLFQLLTEQNHTLIMKTLGLIRNLITNRVHIDQIMLAHGNKIIQAIVMVLEGEFYSLAIKEQALCILANVADGHTAKEFIMGNEDLLRKINSFMTYSSVELQIASVASVFNLVSAADDGAIERQTKLKEMGVHRILQRLLQHNDPLLFEKVKNTLQQFALPSNTIPPQS